MCEMNSTVNLSFRYSESDYVRALRAHYASHLRLPLDIAVVVLLIATGAYLWRTSSLQWLGIALLIIGVVFALLLLSAFLVIPRLAFRREPKFREDYSLGFSGEGIHFRTAQIDSHLQWGMYSHALVDAHSYVLYYGSRQFTVVPRRVFKSAEERQVFEKLLTENISQIVRS